jgi:hypothetical protein
MRGSFLSIRRKVEAGFAGAIKLGADCANLSATTRAKTQKGRVFLALPAPGKGQERAKTSARWPPPGVAEALPSTSSSAEPLSAYEDLPRRRLWPARHTIQINVLLCILKGFALAKPLCCRIK